MPEDVFLADTVVIVATTILARRPIGEALMIRVDRKLNSTDVLNALTDRFILRGPPE